MGPQTSSIFDMEKPQFNMDRLAASIPGATKRAMYEAVRHRWVDVSDTVLKGKGGERFFTFGGALSFYVIFEITRYGVPLEDAADIAEFAKLRAYCLYGSELVIKQLKLPPDSTIREKHRTGYCLNLFYEKGKLGFAEAWETEADAGMNQVTLTFSPLHKLGTLMILRVDKLIKELEHQLAKVGRRPDTAMTHNAK